MTKRGEKVMGWYGIDLDGTLAVYDGWKGADHIGEPVGAMLFRVKKLLDDKKDVRIFTARASDPTQIPFVEAWCEKHLGQKLVVTNIKDFGLIQFFDDRAIQIEENTGRRIDGKP